MKWILVLALFSGCAKKPKLNLDEDLLRFDPCGNTVEQADKEWKDPSTCKVG
jgi:hypothetical protein